MDELSLLEADSIGARALAEAESASRRLPAPDFTGSLEYIDSLASRVSVSISQRDLATIATGLINTYDYLSPLLSDKAVLASSYDDSISKTDFRPLGDARRFDPEVRMRPPRALVRSASRIVSPLNEFPPGWRNPLDPDRPTGDINRAIDEMERRARRQPFKNWSRRFEKPNQVVICLKRKIRRQVMAAMGYLGGYGFKPPVRTYYSRIIC